jgi:lipoprotein NlpI
MRKNLNVIARSLLVTFVVFPITTTLLFAKSDVPSSRSHADSNCVNFNEITRARDIRACTKIIRDRRYTPIARAQAYQSRGLKYAIRYVEYAFNHKSRDADRAIADLTSSIALDPNKDFEVAMSYQIRGSLYYGKGMFDRAAADLTEAIRRDQNRGMSSGAYKLRGLIRLFNGSFEEARADLKRASEVFGADLFSALWLDIAERRSGLASHLSEHIASQDKSNWPSPIVRVFLGQITPDAAIAAAAVPKSKTTPFVGNSLFPLTQAARHAKRTETKKCQAMFFNGEFSLVNGAKDEAVRLFRLVVDDCRTVLNGWTGEWIEYFAAKAELSALMINSK